MCIDYFIIVELAVFLVISLGWTLTNPSPDPSYWRYILAFTAFFYLFSSVLLVLETTSISREVYLALNFAIYTLLYILIFRWCYITLSSLKFSYLPLAIVVWPTTIFSPELQELHDSPQLQPYFHKYRIFLWFIISMIITLICEFLYHIFFIYSYSMTSLLMFYEVSNALILGSLAYFFRPQEHSPLFFVMPSAIGTNQVNPNDNNIENVNSR